MTIAAFDTATFSRGTPARATAKPGLLQRLFDRYIEARTAEAERQVARYRAIYRRDTHDFHDALTPLAPLPFDRA